MSLANCRGMMNETPARPGPAGKTPPPVTVAELRRHIETADHLHIVDVREPAAFHPSHIGGSINSPDSLTTALVKRIQALEWAILVCQDGRQSAMVVKTLGFCGFRKLAYLEGGLNAWIAAGGRMVETTRSGFEHALPPPEPGQPAPPRRGITQILASLLKRD